MSDTPTEAQWQHASDVLLWLFETVDDGYLRDEISHVRFELDRAMEQT